MAVVLVVVLGLCVAAANLGGRLVSGAVAQAAADAAALAGALDGPAAAGAVASANDGDLVEFRQAGPFVQVVVSRSGRQATATAERYQAPPG
jgi:hypothetical protein